MSQIIIAYRGPSPTIEVHSQPCQGARNPMFSGMPPRQIQIRVLDQGQLVALQNLVAVANQVLKRDSDTEKNLHYTRCKKYLPLAVCLAGFTACIIFMTLGSISQKGSDGEKGYIAAAVVTGVFFTVIGVRFKLM